MKKISIFLFLLLFIFTACKDEKTLKSSYTVGCDMIYPFLYKNGTGKLTGFEYELLMEIAKKSGFKLNFIEKKFEQIIPGVVKNELDIGINSYSMTDERKQKVDFSEHYMYSDVVTISNRENVVLNIKAPIYGVTKGTYFLSLIQDIKNVKLLEESSNEKVIEMLLSKELDYAVFDKNIAMKYIEKHPELYIKEILKRDYIGFVFSKELGEKFKRKVSEALLKIDSDGTLAKLKAKYNIQE